MLSFSQLLDGLEISLSPFSVCEVRRGAGLVLKESPAASLHYVLRGSGTMRRTGGWRWALPGNTLVILPARTQVTITCEHGRPAEFPEPRCEPIPGGWEWIEVGDGSPGIVMACADLQVSHRGIVGLFDYLNEPLVEGMRDEPAFADAIELLLAELAFPKPGTPVLATTLMKQCLIVLLRRYWENDEIQAPWLASVQHPQLGQAIVAMMNEPGAPFTLAALAEIAGMSRTAFAEHFKRKFGRSAMDYLREVRLQRAAGLLRGTDLPVKAVAERVGFASRSHFTRIFKAFAGTQPAEYRLSRRQA